jgi:hypothetical protein
MREKILFSTRENSEFIPFVEIEWFAIKNEEDLELRPGWYVSPLPIDGKCQVCGRLLSQLKPFDRYDGCLLVKNYRKEIPIDEDLEPFSEEYDEYMDDEPDNDDFDDILVERYGKEEAERIMTYINQTRLCASWECRDCYCLSDTRYFRLLNNLYKPNDLE